MAEQYANGLATIEELKTTRDAARAAAGAAWAAWAARDAQLKKLIEMILEGDKTGDVK